MFAHYIVIVYLNLSYLVWPADFKADLQFSNTII